MSVKFQKPVLLPQTPLPWCEAFDASDRDVRTISLILLEVYRRLRVSSVLPTKFTNLTLCFSVTRLRSFIELQSSSVLLFKAPNWLRLNDVLNKIRGSSSATDVRNGELKNASSAAVAELERKRREIVAKADEMRRLQNGTAKLKKS